MLTMRLQRIGKRGQAYFRIIVTEHTRKAQGEYLELLGSYDPHKKDLKVKKERIEHWMSKGVQLSPTVNNLLVNNKIIVATKKLSWKPKVVAKTPSTTSTSSGQASSGQAAPKAKDESKDEPVVEPEAETPAAEPQVEETSAETKEIPVE